MDKGPDAFRTISEVAADLDLPQHVLRFWESKFAHIKPLKRGGGRRYYRPDDVELLKGIRYLLYGEGYTIRGVQRILKEQGVRFVMNVWHEGAPQPPDDDFEPDMSAQDAHFDADDLPASDFDGAESDEDEPVTRRGRTTSFDDEQPASAAAIAQRFAPASAAGRPAQAPAAPVPARQARTVAQAQAKAATHHDDDEESRSALGALIDRFRPGSHGRAEPSTPAQAARLSREEVRQLQSTLFELLECKRLLDQAR